MPNPILVVSGEAIVFHRRRNKPHSKMLRCLKLKFTANVGHLDTILVASSN